MYKAKNKYTSNKCHNNYFAMQKITPEKPTSSHFINKPTSVSKSNICTCEPDKSSIISIVCRICYDGDKDEPIITPCRCRGTVAFVHRSCLETWLAESNTTSCELCHHIYKTERTPKYTARQSIWRWFRHQPLNIGFHVRGLRSDVLACAILTPLAIVITYVCLFSADYYNQKKFSNIPAAKWTSVSLLVMISIMLMGYYLWVYMVIRYHGRVWFYCWQRECVVRYIAPSSQNICYHHNINGNENNQFPSDDQSIIFDEISENENTGVVNVIDIDHGINIPEPTVVVGNDNLSSSLQEVAIVMTEMHPATLDNSSSNDNNNEDTIVNVVNVNDTVV